MASYDLEEQEKLDELKAWWKLHGNTITSLLLAVSLTAAGWQGWKWYQRNQSVQAAGIYGVLQSAASEKDIQRVKSAAGELLEKHSRSSYAPLAAMVVGKLAFESGDMKTAKLQLTWAIDHAEDELKDVARLRMAAVLLDGKEYDAALDLMKEPEVRSFAARFDDVRGDILLAQGKPVEAKAAYQSALKKGELAASKQGSDSDSALTRLVQQKLDALGGI